MTAAANPLPDGRVEMWLGGRFGPVTRSEAVRVVADLALSPIPESRRRAEAVRQALIQGQPS